MFRFCSSLRGIMPDGPVNPTPPLPWLAAATAAAMQAAWRARGEDAAREVALARHPALPLTLIEEAVALLARR
jgi:hypothetical protein